MGLLDFIIGYAVHVIKEAEKEQERELGKKNSIEVDYRIIEDGHSPK